MVLVVVVVEEEEVWYEKRQGREGEVQGCCMAGGDSVKCKAKASRAMHSPCPRIRRRGILAVPTREPQP